MLRNRFRFIVLILALLIPTAIVAAAETVTVGNFQIDLVSHVTNPDDTDTFTYAVTATGPTQALSHWTLGMDTCVDHLVSPQAGPYTTVTGIAECGGNPYLCQASNYTVVTGNDPTLQINGIKFEDGSPQLTEGNTHIFEITVEEFAYLTELNVGAKYGASQPKAKIDGPVCGTGTAVSLASSDVGSAQPFTIATTPLLFAAMLLLAGATFFVWRRDVATVRSDT